MRNLGRSHPEKAISGWEQGVEMGKWRVKRCSQCGCRLYEDERNYCNDCRGVRDNLAEMWKADGRAEGAGIKPAGHEQRILDHVDRVQREQQEQVGEDEQRR